MLYKGLLIDNTYQIIDEIGSGGMGVVYLAQHLRLEKYVVLKKIKNTVEDIYWLRNEVDILKSLHHPCLPQVYDFIQYDNDLFTVIDYIHGYDLKYYLTNGYSFTENQLIKWLRQLADVLCYLHNHVPPIYHTDIKPANIIITESMDICLIDFGISLTGKYQVHGISAYYSSPEQYANAVYIRSGQSDMCVALDGRTDIYSVGATFYHLMTGVCPNLLNPPPPITSYSLPYSDSLVHIVSKTMQTNAADRYKNAVAFRKAVDNIHKSALSYRLNLIAQIVASLLAGIMIISGAFLVINDVRDSKRSVYENDYSRFVELYKKGDYESTIQLGRKILNDTDYQEMTDIQTRAEILHSIGDCYFNEEDYGNAVENYCFAYGLAKDLDNAEIFYRDYAMALVYTGNKPEAERVFGELNDRYPDSIDTYIVMAQMNHDNSAKALKCAQKALELSKNTESEYTVLELMGDICAEAGDVTSAADYYRKAREKRETDVIIRKLGNIQLKRCAQSAIYAFEAKECFSTLYYHYFATENDIFNLCQSCLLTGDEGTLKEALDIARNYIDNYNESCEIDIVIALMYEVKDDPLAGKYAVKAYDIYQQLPLSEKEKINSESLSEVSRIYKKYTGGIW